MARYYQVHNVLNRYVIDKSGGTHDVPLDDSMMYDIHDFLDQYRHAYPSSENGDILLNRFLYNKMAEYESTLKMIWDHRRIQEEKLWRKPSPYGVNSRNMDGEDPVKAKGRYMFSNPPPFRKEYLASVGIGVPRNRKSW